MSPTALESAYEWYTSGPRQRLQPGGKIILVMTRWSNKDLTGKLIQNQKEACLLYTSPSPRDRTRSRMPSSA